MMTQLRYFSNGKKDEEPVEYTVNEDELFGEKKMKEAQMSISEKLKAIKAKQMADKASEDPDHVHDPSKF